MTQIDDLMAIVADLRNTILELNTRIEKLEKITSVDGVYLDGVPDYVKMYVSEPRKE